MASGPEAAGGSEGKMKGVPEKAGNTVRHAPTGARSSRSGLTVRGRHVRRYAEGAAFRERRRRTANAPPEARTKAAAALPPVTAQDGPPPSAMG